MKKTHNHSMGDWEQSMMEDFEERFCTVIGCLCMYPCCYEARRWDSIKCGEIGCKDTSLHYHGVTGGI